MKKKTVIRLETSSEKQVQTLLKALLPETRKPANFRSKVSIKGEGRTLTIQVDAKDISALRATLNSYLRWIALIEDTFETVVQLERRRLFENT